MSSEPLAQLLGVTQLSRPQAVKHIWVYIKEKDLQNPSDKREIICDEKMKNIFRVDKIGMFKMNQMLGEYVALPMHSKICSLFSQASPRARTHPAYTGGSIALHIRSVRLRLRFVWECTAFNFPSTYFVLSLTLPNYF